MYLIGTFFPSGPRPVNGGCFCLLQETRRPVFLGRSHLALIATKTTLYSWECLGQSKATVSSVVSTAWRRFFRQEAEGSRVIALLAALFFGATAIVMVLGMQVSDWHYPAFFTIGYPLCALAFLLYTIKGREH